MNNHLTIIGAIAVAIAGIQVRNNYVSLVRPFLSTRRFVNYI